MRTGSMRARCALVIAALVATGCGGVVSPPAPPRADPGDKTGARSGPITITVVDSLLQGKPSNLPLNQFASEVASRSGGSIVVQVLADKEGDAIPIRLDPAVISAVKSGEVEMAVVPTRAWSDAGVMSFRALQAPLVIGSDEQVAAIVRDDAITEEFFRGLDGFGVTGLVLYPEGLRHLFSFGAPILTPADVAGRQIKTTRSADLDAIIEGFGGVPNGANFDALANAISDGTISGIESAFTLMRSEPRLPIATGNVALYAKVDSLVVNDDFWASLTDAQRAIVRDAAVEAREWAIRNVPSDADAAASYCATGGSVVLADQASIDEFRAAALDVTAELAKDPATDALISRIRDAAVGLSPEPVKACKAPISMTISPDGGDLPNGIYRVEYTDEYLKGWGVTNVNDQHGVYTYRLEDGHWTLDQRADNVTDHAEGIYQVRGGELYWRWDNDPGKPIDHLTWSVAPNGDVTFAAVGEISEGWTFGLPLIRASALPD